MTENTPEPEEKKSPSPGFFFSDLEPDAEMSQTPVPPQEPQVLDEVSTDEVPPPLPQTNTLETLATAESSEAAEILTPEKSVGDEREEARASFAETGTVRVVTEPSPKPRPTLVEQFLSDIEFDFEPDEDSTTEIRRNLASHPDQESSAQPTNWDAPTVVQSGVSPRANTTAPTQILSETDLQKGTTAVKPSRQRDTQLTRILPPEELADTLPQPAAPTVQTAATVILKAADLAQTQVKAHNLPNHAADAEVDSLFQGEAFDATNLQLDPNLDLPPGQGKDFAIDDFLARLGAAEKAEKLSAEINQEDLFDTAGATSEADDLPPLLSSAESFGGGGILPEAATSRNLEDNETGYALAGDEDLLDLLASLPVGDDSFQSAPPENVAEFGHGKNPEEWRKKPGGDDERTPFGHPLPDAENADDFLTPAPLPPLADEGGMYKAGGWEPNNPPRPNLSALEEIKGSLAEEMLFEDDDGEDLFATPDLDKELDFASASADADWGGVETLPEPPQRGSAEAPLVGEELTAAAPVDLLAAASEQNPAADSLAAMQGLDFDSELSLPATPQNNAYAEQEDAELEDAFAMDDLLAPSPAQPQAPAESLAEIMGEGVLDEMFSAPPEGETNLPDLGALLNDLSEPAGEGDEASAADNPFESPEDILEPSPPPQDTMELLEAGLMVEASADAQADIEALFQNDAEAPSELDSLSGGDDEISKDADEAALLAGTNDEIKDLFNEPAAFDSAGALDSLGELDLSPGGDKQKAHAKKSASEKGAEAAEGGWKTQLMRVVKLAAIPAVIAYMVTNKKMNFRKNWWLYCDVLAAVIFIISLAFLFVIGSYSNFW